MEIIFESTGSTAGFESWLRAFSIINDSLLIEVDTNEQKFVAKTHTTDKTIVKYGAISFEEAGYQVTGITNDEGTTYTLDDWNAQSPDRIKIGIFKTIDKFIKTVGIFSGSENHKMTIGFKIDVNGTARNFVGTQVRFNSLSLTMMVHGAELEEFVYISDEKFIGGIAAIENPLSFDVDIDTSKMLLNVSNIYSVDPKKDIINFTTVNEPDGCLLHAIDHNNKSYNFKISYLKEGEEPAEVSVPVIRNNYILATKSDTENNVITLPGIAGKGNKIKIASGNNFITIVASVRVGE